MRTVLAIVIFHIALIFVCGCKSISVGGRGQVGVVTGGGSVDIPIPGRK